MPSSRFMMSLNYTWTLWGEEWCLVELSGRQWGRIRVLTPLDSASGAAWSTFGPEGNEVLFLNRSFMLGHPAEFLHRWLEEHGIWTYEFQQLLFRGRHCLKQVQTRSEKAEEKQLASPATLTVGYFHFSSMNPVICCCDQTLTGIPICSQTIWVLSATAGVTQFLLNGKTCPSQSRLKKL